MPLQPAENIRFYKCPGPGFTKQNILFFLYPKWFHLRCLHGPLFDLTPGK
jgi:hypothetical protein